MCPPQATAQPGHWHVLMKDAGRCPKLKRTCSMASLSFCASSASPCATATARGMGPNGCRSATALSLVGCRSRLVESDKKPTAWPEPISASASAQQGEGSRQQGRFLYVCQAACLGGASPVSVIHIFLLCNQRQCSALLQRNLSPLRRPASPSALATGTSSIPSFCPSWGSYKLARATTRLPFRSSQVLTPSGAAPSGVNRAAAAPKWAAAGLDWCRKGSGGSDDGSMWFPGRLQLQQQHCCRLWTADSDHAMGHRAVAAVCAGRLSSSYSGQNFVHTHQLCSTQAGQSQSLPVHRREARRGTSGRGVVRPAKLRGRRQSCDGACGMPLPQNHHRPRAGLTSRAVVAPKPDSTKSTVSLARASTRSCRPGSQTHCKRAGMVVAVRRTGVPPQSCGTACRDVRQARHPGLTSKPRSVTPLSASIRPTSKPDHAPWSSARGSGRGPGHHAPHNAPPQGGGGGGGRPGTPRPRVHLERFVVGLERARRPAGAAG